VAVNDAAPFIVAEQCSRSVVSEGFGLGKRANAGEQTDNAWLPGAPLRYC
jgi:hypothetical protein